MIVLFTPLICSISSIKLVVIASTCFYLESSYTTMLGLLHLVSASAVTCVLLCHEPAYLALWGYMDPYIMTSKQC
ncbi:hypothetical protein PILCRDRAFT_661797 [Piloderma croceum F 1598]|uniref:Uncharacterized protein n=1 Tax=Piloderma croceum (strain F 1598) TaxID=765440 RepID=A0A0C3BFA1_PILCF|nr:hypothetical protein PILCRDRAFT_661797 [Piloderma croceum F 1598]